MPNSRRRRFSVCNSIAGQEPHKGQNSVNSCTPDSSQDTKICAVNCGTMRSSILKNLSNPSSPTNSSKDSNINPEYDRSYTSIKSVTNFKKRSNTTSDKDITTDSSKLVNLHKVVDNLQYLVQSSSETMENETAIKSRKQLTNDRASLRRDKLPYQHRVKVRSPKRRPVILDPPNKTNDIIKMTVNVATEPIDWEREASVCPDRDNNVEGNEVDEDRSDHSCDDMCRICHGGDSLSLELGQLISACCCRGTVGRVHVKCLERWLTESGKSRCELCGTRYATCRVHRYGVVRALVMWILSQNAKQLMVDSLGIMLMSPLAVLAAWLSGRTLAGLMTQDTLVTPWPLASTFVLACMTLVCYYCWVVSAATRHALGWWVWYRSQYEVRLQLENDDE